MAKSSTDNHRKLKLKNQKAKIMSEQNQKPQIRQIPRWKSQDKFEITGLELEWLYNYINNAQQAYAAMQTVMNRAIISGKVDLDFEKLSEDGTTFVAMTDEEKKPYRDELASVVAAAKLREEADLKSPATPKSESKIITSDEPAIVQLDEQGRTILN